jgi:hypothetical protein
VGVIEAKLVVEQYLKAQVQASSTPVRKYGFPLHLPGGFRPPACCRLRVGCLGRPVSQGRAQGMFHERDDPGGADRFPYIEGYVVPANISFPVMHAWNLDERGLLSRPRCNKVAWSTSGSDSLRGLWTMLSRMQRRHSDPLRSLQPYPSEESTLLVFWADVTMGHDRRFGWSSASAQYYRGDVFGDGV